MRRWLNYELARYTEDESVAVRTSLEVRRYGNTPAFPIGRVFVSACWLRQEGILRHSIGCQGCGKAARGKFYVSTELVEGHPKSKIIDIADNWRADMIVLGSHGRTGLSRFLMGSVSQAVVRHAHCSVEIIRSGS